VLWKSVGKIDCWGSHSQSSRRFYFHAAAAVVNGTCWGWELSFLVLAQPIFNSIVLTWQCNYALNLCNFCPPSGLLMTSGAAVNWFVFLGFFYLGEIIAMVVNVAHSNHQIKLSGYKCYERGYISLLARPKKMKTNWALSLVKLWPFLSSWKYFVHLFFLTGLEV